MQDNKLTVQDEGDFTAANTYEYIGFRWDASEDAMVVLYNNRINNIRHFENSNSVPPSVTAKCLSCYIDLGYNLIAMYYKRCAVLL